MKRTKNTWLPIKPNSNQAKKKSLGDAVYKNALKKRSSEIEDLQSDKLEIIDEDEGGLSNTNQFKLTGIIADIEAHLINIKNSVYEIGGLLSEAKSILPHGSFEKWIEEHFKSQLPYPTAYLYMKVYKTFEGTPELVRKIPTTLLMSMNQQSFPLELVKQIKDNAEFLDVKDIKNVNFAYKQYKAKVINLTQFEKAVHKQIRLAGAISKGVVERRISNNNRITLRQGVEQIIKAIRTVRSGINDMSYLFPKVEDSEEQKALLESVKKAMSELQLMKDDVEKDTGLFNPKYPKNPLLEMDFKK